MPPLGGPGPRRVDTRAVKRRKRNLAKIPKQPTATQLRQSRVQEQQYKSQAGAVRRAAKVQEPLGPGKAVRPPKGEPVLHRADILPYVQAETYKSLARAVEKDATEQKKRKRPKQDLPKIKVPAIYLERDPEKLAAAGFKKPGALE